MHGKNAAPKRLPNAAWAWEFLRRNSDYQREYYGSQKAIPKTVNLHTGGKLLKARRAYPGAEKWGLMFYANPQMPAPEADVFWNPGVFPASLAISLRSLDGDDIGVKDGEDIILLSAIKTRRVSYEAVNGMRHILLSGQRFWIQLHCQSDAIPGETGRVGIRIDGTDGMKRRLDTAAQLLSLYKSSGRKLPLIGRTKNSTRLSNALLAFDTYLVCEDRKKVAQAVYGKERVTRDWVDPHYCLQDQTRRLLARSKALVTGGYLDLLSKKTL